MLAELCSFCDWKRMQIRILRKKKRKKENEKGYLCFLHATFKYASVFLASQTANGICRGHIRHNTVLIKVHNSVFSVTVSSTTTPSTTTSTTTTTPGTGSEGIKYRWIVWLSHLIHREDGICRQCLLFQRYKVPMIRCNTLS